MSREEFHEVLCDILGSRNVYFQPPESLKIKYPAIIYKLDKIKTSRANNDLYLADDRMAVTLVHKEPDNDVYMKLLKLPKSSLDRTYAKDNLNHYAFTIYI
jgi:hypothetical protein